MRKYLIATLLVILLSACAPSPQDYADAEATRLRAQAEATRTAQETVQKQAEWQLAQAERQAITNQVITAFQVFVFVVLVCASLAIFGAACGFYTASVEVGKATGQAAMVRANLVYLDKNTGQFPVYISGPMLANPNDGSVMDTSHALAADPAKILTAGDTQHDGVISRNVRMQARVMGLDLRMGRQDHEQLEVIDERD